MMTDRYIPLLVLATAFVALPITPRTVSNGIAVAQSAQVPDGTWVGGWQAGNGVQLIIVSGQIIGLNIRGDYVDVTNVNIMPDGRIAFTWPSATGVVSSRGSDGVQLTISERGKPPVSVSLKRDH